MGSIMHIQIGIKSMIYINKMDMMNRIYSAQVDYYDHKNSTNSGSYINYEIHDIFQAIRRQIVNIHVLT